MSQKLYLVHCGYYDAAVAGGVFESHVNYFVAASSFEDAKVKARLIPEFAEKRMHVDGLQEIEAVSGFRVQMIEDSSLQGQSRLIDNKHRDLAPKKPAASSDGSA